MVQAGLVAGSQAALHYSRRAEWARGAEDPSGWLIVGYWP